MGRLTTMLTFIVCSGLVHHLLHLGALILAETVSVHPVEDARHIVGVVLRLLAVVAVITLLARMTDATMIAVEIGLAVQMTGISYAASH